MFDTDHRLLVMDLNFPCSKKDLKAGLLRGRPRENRVQRNFNVLRDEERKRQELTEKLEENLRLLEETSDVDTLNDGIVDAVRKSAEEVCPLVDTEQKKEPWEDRHLTELVEKKRKCNSKEDIKSYQNQIKKHCKRLKNEYFKELADNINTVAEARQVDKEFALAKKYTTLKSGEKTVISKSKLKTHFESHFAERPHLELPEELQHSEKFPHLADEPFIICEYEPDGNEVKQATGS